MRVGIHCGDSMRENEHVIGERGGKVSDKEREERKGNRRTSVTERGKGKLQIQRGKRGLVKLLAFNAQPTGAKREGDPKRG